MDRSFLSQNSVIQASRRFVCIRTLTYEDAEERDFQRSLFIGGSGDVENTTFCILSPDGKQPIVRAGRSIRQVFRSPEQMQEWMDQAADYYEAERKKQGKKPEPITALPRIADVRLGLNTAAADDLPLVVLFAKSAADAARLEAAAADLAWKPEFIGRYVFASAGTAAELTAIKGAATKPGLLVIQPGGFGLSGRILAHADPSATTDQLAEALRQGRKAFKPRRLQGFDYLRAGHEAGVFWETRLPVTDLHEARARERARRGARR